MLSQRLAKAYLFKTYNTNTEVAQKEIGASVILFEENLKNLLAFSPNPNVKAKFTAIESLWQSYKATVSTPEATQEGVAFLLANNTPLLNACEEGVQELLRYSKSLPKIDNGENEVAAEAVAQYISSSGRVRMLSQRLTLYYGAYYWSNDPRALETAKIVADNVQGILMNITTAEINDQATDDAISDVIREWYVIKESCSRNNCIDFEKKNMPPIKMYDTANKVLSRIEKVVQAYAGILK